VTVKSVTVMVSPVTVPLVTVSPVTVMRARS